VGGRRQEEERQGKLRGNLVRGKVRLTASVGETTES